MSGVDQMERNGLLVIRGMAISTKNGRYYYRDISVTICLHFYIWFPCASGQTILSRAFRALESAASQRP